MEKLLLEKHFLATINSMYEYYNLNSDKLSDEDAIVLKTILYKRIMELEKRNFNINEEILSNAVHAYLMYIDEFNHSLQKVSR